VKTDLGKTVASPKTADAFQSFVNMVAGEFSSNADENPLPAAAKVLGNTMVALCYSPGEFTAPSPARMLLFLINVCIRYCAVQEVNPRNIRMPGIDKIAQCVEEMLQQLRLSAAEAQIESNFALAGQGRGIFAESVVSPEDRNAVVTALRSAATSGNVDALKEAVARAEQLGLVFAAQQGRQQLLKLEAAQRDAEVT
jgi:hypothetical protein